MFRRTPWPSKAIEQYFPVVLFIVLYKVVQILESVDEILRCDHSVQYRSAIMHVLGGSSSVLSAWIKS